MLPGYGLHQQHEDFHPGCLNPTELDKASAYCARRATHRSALNA